VLAGDAGGAVNPFNGEGIAYGYETGRLAAAYVGQALDGGGPAALLSYEQRLAEVYGSYFRVARAFVRLISNPRVMRTCVGNGLRSEMLMAQLLRIMANLMRPDVLGPAEVGFRAMEAFAHLLPDGVVHGPESS
jgi:flavin-dependent dehydrogenase